MGTKKPASIALAVLSFCVTSAPAQDSLTTGLVAWWKLDETGGRQAADSSGNGLHGTLVGEPKWRPDGGVIGGALEFDGIGDHIVIGNQSQFDLTEGIAVTAWVKVRRFDRNWQAIVTKGDTAWRIARDRDRDCVQFAFSSVPKEQLLKGRINVNDGQWHHVAGVYDGRKMFLYVDGKLDLSAETATSIPVNDQPVYIGENSQRPGRRWNGLIDDVRVYNRALAPQEIEALYGRAGR